MKAYQLHEVMVAPARPTSEIWRLGVAVILIVVGFLALNLVYYRILFQLPNWPALRGELEDGRTARALWVMLGNFLPLTVALALVVRMLHGRPLWALLGPGRLVWFDFRRVLPKLVLLFAVLLVLPAPDSQALEARQSFGAWLSLVPLSMVLIFVQIATEELLFRGYLQSQLAARFSTPWVWMVVPSLVFGMLHYDPATFGDNAVWLAVWAGVFGLVAADLTARAGNLGPALALHFVNNLSAISLTSMRDYWDGLALFVVPYGPEDVDAVRATLPPEALGMLCGWLVVRIAIRR